MNDSSTLKCSKHCIEMIKFIFVSTSFLFCSISAEENKNSSGKNKAVK